MLNPTKLNRPRKKTIIKLKVKFKKVTQVGLEPWPFTLQESTLPTEPAGHSVDRLHSPLFNKKYLDIGS